MKICSQKIAAILIAGLFCSVSVHAADLSVDSAQDQKVSKDKTVSGRTSNESRSSLTNRTGHTLSNGGESTNSRSSRFTAMMDRRSSLDMQLPISALFMADPSTWKSSADFGLGGNLGGGVINQSAQEFQTGLARAFGKIVDAEVDETVVKKYILQVALKGAEFGQAAINLQEDISSVGRLVRTSGGVGVKGLGADDLKTLARGAMIRGKTITDSRLKHTYSHIVQEVLSNDCRFANDVNAIKCGGVMLNVTTPPTLRYNGINWFGSDGFGGFNNITYRIASNWSYSQALESMKSNSNFSRWADEIATAAEELESAGRSREAVITKRKAVEKAASSKAGLSVSKFLPNHQQ